MTSLGPRKPIGATLRRARLFLLGLALVATSAAHSQADGRAALEQRQRKAAPPPEPLSAEDAALVKEMALLERVDLLRNMELFEDGEHPQHGGPPPDAPKARP